MSEKDANNGPKPAPQQTNVALRMLVAVLVGACVGYVLGLVLAPDFAPVFGLLGAMSFGAGMVVSLLLTTGKTDAQDDT